MTIAYREPADEDDGSISDLVLAAFDSHIAPGMADEGIEEFRDFAHPNSIRARRKAPHPTHHQLVAVLGTQDPVVAGVAEIRDWEHLSMLFVHPDHHRHHIGSGLFKRIRAAVLAARPDQPCITVYSSLFAVPIYERMGFFTTSAAVNTRGIVHVPMVLELG